MSGLRRLALPLIGILAVLAAIDAWAIGAWAQPRGQAPQAPAPQALPPPPAGTSRGENFSAKPPSQLFASDCTGAGCHRGPQGLAKDRGRGGLASFLREHYTNSRESASALADYLSGVPGEARAVRPERPEPGLRTEPGQRTRAAGRPDEAPKPEDGTARPRRPGEPAEAARPETRTEPRPGSPAARAVQRARQQQQATAPEPPPPPPPPPEPPKPQVFDIFD